MCGGTPRVETGVSAIEGLSPRVRGNRYLMFDRFTSLGSIPACAGEPVSVGGLVGHASVYPRVCGGTPWGFCQGGLWGEVPPMGWTLGLCGRVMVVRGYWGCLIMCAKSAGCTSSNGLGRVWVAGISERDVVRFQDVYRPC